MKYKYFNLIKVPKVLKLLRMYSEDEENLEATRVTAKGNLLQQAEHGGQLDLYADSLTPGGNKWTETAWKQLCSRTRNLLEELNVPNEKIEEILREASEKVELTDDTTISYLKKSS